MPNTDLSVLITGEEISLVHNLNKDYKGISPLDEGADFWLLSYGDSENIGVPKGEGIIKNISEFLDDVHIPEDKIPEYIKENIGEKNKCIS